MIKSRAFAAPLALAVAIACLPEVARAEEPPAHPAAHGPRAPLPPPPPPAATASRRHSTAMMVTGIVLTSLGAATVLAGGLYMGGGEGENVSTGAVIMVPGLVAMAAGIPLWIVGASADSPSRPSVSVGPRSVGLRFAF